MKRLDWLARQMRQSLAAVGRMEQQAVSRHSGEPSQQALSYVAGVKAFAEWTLKIIEDNRQWQDMRMFIDAEEFSSAIPEDASELTEQ